jgi:hypothetical protein
MLVSDRRGQRRRVEYGGHPSVLRSTGARHSLAVHVGYRLLGYRSQQDVWVEIR